MLFEVFRYELTSQLRRVSAAIYAIALAALTLLAASTFLDNARTDGALLNSPLMTAACTVMLTMFGLLVTAAIAGEAATRDAQARMEPLLYATPLRKRAYIGGRFLAAFAIGALLLAIGPLTLLLGTFLPGIEPSYLGPIRPLAYLQAYALTALPNAFIITALLFSLVMLTRRAMIAYLGAALLFINTMVQDEVVAGALKRWDLAKLFDPFAFMIVRAQWRSLTPQQRNTFALDVDEAMLVNRLLWIATSLAALTLVHLRLRMAHDAPSSGRRRKILDAPIDSSITLTMPRIRGHFDAITRIRQTLAIALDAYRAMLFSRAALLLPLIAVFLTFVGPEMLEVGLGTPGRLSTGRLATALTTFPAMSMAIGALIAFFAGQLIWRERDARQGEITGVTPVPEIVTLGGKFLALLLLILTILGVVMATGIATQIGFGYADVEPLLWLQLLGIRFADYVLFALLAMTLHVAITQKHVAMALAFLVWLFPMYAGELGLEHPLLVFGSAPPLAYLEMTGFGAVGPWLVAKLYWLGWAMLFALLALRRFAMTPVALAIILGAGGVAFYETNVAREYLTDNEAAERAAEYERCYARYANVPQPALASTRLLVELHPREQRADVRGTYRLENRGARSIDAIHVVTHRTIPLSAVTFDRGARATVIDAKLGYRIYELARPLAPGETLSMSFEVRMRGFAGFIEHRPDDTGRSWLPSIGYRRGVELDNAGDRRAHGLAARPAHPRLEDVAARQDTRGVERIHLETIIGTDAEEIAIAPGALRRSWSEGARRYFHYATDAPIRNGFPILSARYAVHRSRWKDVDVEVVHHPEHAWNAERIARAARATLEVLSRELGPYPHKQLRLVEFPESDLRLTGHPGTVIFSETFAFTHPEEDERKMDFPFAVIAHEVAHQWWGNQVVPARVEGAPVLSESLAWYSAMLVVEETHGREERDQILDVMRESYLTPGSTPTVPLLRAVDRMSAYRSGPFALYSLREAIGKERVNLALRNLVAKFGAGTPPYPTTLDLYRELHDVTPVASQSMLHDLFAEITFWDFRMRSMRAEPIAGGRYRVTFDLEAYKVRAGNGPREQRVPLGEAVEIAVFGETRKDRLHLASHRLRDGAQTIVIEVEKRPEFADIDPHNKLLERYRNDNWKAVSP